MSPVSLTMFHCDPITGEQHTAIGIARHDTFQAILYAEQFRALRSIDYLRDTNAHCPTTLRTWAPDNLARESEYLTGDCGSL
jgi:hypothetical protein